MSAVLNKYGFAATRYIVTKARDFAEKNNKKFMVALFDPSVLRQLVQSGTRYDQEIVDFLKENKIRTFDMNVVHVQDFKSFNLSYGDYQKRYFIGHYSPAGNHFFAYSKPWKLFSVEACPTASMCCTSSIRVAATGSAVESKVSAFSTPPPAT